MNDTITLLNRMPDSELDTDIGLLFECAPDSSIRERYPQAIGLTDLIGEFNYIKNEAASLARMLLEKEPLLRGIRQLEVFEEFVIQELKYILHANTLYDALLARGYSKCILSDQSRIGQYLQDIALQKGLLEVLSDKAPGASENNTTSSISRSWRRMSSAGFNRKVVASEWQQVMERIDPYHHRSCFSKKRSVTKGQVWFYSTAHTFTRIGMLYEPWFPRGFNYLIENPLTGGVPLQKDGRRFTSVYDFIKKGMAPRKDEIENAKTTIRNHLKSVELEKKESLVRNVFLKGPGIATFLKRILPQGLLQSALFPDFVEDTEPSAIVLGNPDGYILNAAQQANIPTFLLQHGILGDYCQFVVPPVDHYIVRGTFWQEFLSPEAGARGEILNPPENSIDMSTSPLQRRQKIIYITKPYSIYDFLDASDQSDILSSLLKSCAHTNTELVIRVHPLEQINTYERTIKRLSTQIDTLIEVSYSQGDSLDILLEQAAVAVTHCSTIFLDCLRHKVPIVSFGWQDFSFKQQISKYGVFHFCSSLQELEEMIHQALQGQLLPYAKSTEPFLAITPGDEIRSRVSELMNNIEGHA